MPKLRRAPWIGREKGQPNYCIYWYDECSKRVKRRSSGTCDRIEAEKELGRFLIEKSYEAKASQQPILTPDKYLIATALRWYVQERGEELASASFTGRAVENLIKFFGPNCTVAHVTPQLAKRYVKERTRKVRFYKNSDGETVRVKNDAPLSTSTIKRELGILSTALNHAVAEGRLTSAPKIPLPPDAPNKTRYLEREEIELLLSNCIESHVKLFVLLAINTGARKGAILDLNWAQIDFNNKIIHLNPEWRQQTNKRRAIVPISEALMTALNDQRHELKKLQEEAAAAGEPMQMCPYVISYRNGPIANIKVGFRMACERAGLVGVTPHTLRHTAGSLMAIAGVDLFLIARLLGHSVQKTTELYAHLHPNYLRGAVSVLSAATPKMRLYQVE